MDSADHITWRTRTHVSQKASEVLSPWKVHSYAFGSVISVVFVVRFVATLFNRLPTNIFSGALSLSCQTVRKTRGIRFYCPRTVTRFVTNLWIDAFKPMLRCWRLTHIRQKLFEIISPPLANRYANIAWRTTIQAPRLYVGPNPVDACVLETVYSKTFTRLFVSEASAASIRFLSDQTGGSNLFLDSAIAPTVPVADSIFASTFRNDRQSTRTHPSKVMESHL